MGIEVNGGWVSFNNKAALARIHKAITAPRR
jgi:hypothetical protein